MSRRRSSVLPFNVTAASRTLHGQSSHVENATFMRSKKTPAKRRRTQIDISRPAGMEDETIEIFEDIKDKMWNVCRVSVLNNFDCNKPSTITRYGRTLARYLVDSFSEAVTLKATFVIKQDVPGFEGRDPPIHVRVEDVQFENPRIIYEGIFLSTIESGDDRLEGAVHLPILFARGTRYVRTKVHECLASLFSSAIHEISFPREDMLWMVAALSGYISDKTKKEVQFLYAVPPKTDTIQCQYPARFIKDLWNCSHNEENRIVELSEVKEFHNSLVKHTTQTIGLNLNAMSLMMYKTPDFELHSTGKVKMKNVEFIPRILHFVADLCETRSRADTDPT